MRLLRFLIILPVYALTYSCGMLSNKATSETPTPPEGYFLAWADEFYENGKPHEDFCFMNKALQGTKNYSGTRKTMLL